MIRKFESSFNICEETLNKLKQLIPEAFKDGLVDIGALSDALSGYSGEDLNIDDNLFGLYWPGKRQAKKAAATPPIGTLVPVPGDGIDEDTTKNIYIEGDNLEVLKIIKEAYKGEINIIYIDPPYNMGSDEIYKDDFSESEESYLFRTGQIDENGIKLTANSKSEGRFHSNWLSIIYPRIKIAFPLLKEGGIIFISIGEDEVHNLRHICNEIFGEENFIAQIPWRKRTAKSDVPFGISQDYDWILSYAKSEVFSAGKEGGTRKYFETDDLPGRPWRFHDLTKQTSASDRPNSFFTLIDPKNGKEYPANPNRTWAITEDTFKKYYKENRIIFPGDYNFLNISKPAFRYFKDEDIKKADGLFGFTAVSTQLPENVGRSEDGTKEITELFGSKVFNFPKPVNLIKYLIKIATFNDKEVIVIDFFSGSSTTAHAVMKLNAESDKNFHFMMIQLQESCKKNSEAFKAGFKTISEIGKERIRLAGKKIKEDTSLNAKYVDIGFKVFRLAPSNFKPIDPYTGTNIKELSDWFSGDPLIEGWKPENLITEVMLKEGFPLDSAIARLDSFNKNKVYQISSDSCDHSLFICLDTHIDNDTIDKLDLGELNIFICLDSAITDQVKARLDDKGRIMVI